MPPFLAGRQALVDAFSVAVRRVMIGRNARSLLPYGLRGVGKTVLLQRFIADARAVGFLVALVEADENTPFVPALADQLRRILFELDTPTKVNALAKRAMRIFKSFTIKSGLEGISMSLGVDAERGFADSGDIATDITTLFVSIGEAARDQGLGVLVAIDEIQYLSEREFNALIKAIHSITQLSLPVVLVATGLPQVLALLGEAKSYAERLFDFTPVGALDVEQVRTALVEPAAAEGVVFEPAAVDAVFADTKGYPFFLQEWAYQAWNVAKGPAITLGDVERAAEIALPKLDGGFFAVRYDRCTPTEKRYLRAMADLGTGPYRTAEISKRLHRSNSAVAPYRDALIKKGMIWSPEHGALAFTVPLFDEFMWRREPSFL